MGLYFSHIDTLFGMAAATVDEDGALLEFTFLNGEMSGHFSRPDKAEHEPSRLRDVTRQVHEFFDRKRTVFTLDLKPRGTDFQLKVWKELRRIPRGERRTYTEIATNIGRPAAVRAVANACGQNPVALAVPCHRVVRSDGKTSGYKWGADRKRRLLDDEARKL